MSTWTNINDKGKATKSIWIKESYRRVERTDDGWRETNDPTGIIVRMDIANFVTQHDFPEYKAVENASYACAAVNYCKKLGLTIKELETI